MMLFKLLNLRTRAVKSFLTERRPEKILNFFVGVGVSIFFITLGYWFFEYIFNYLQKLGDVGNLLMGKVMALAFFAVMILLFVSNLLTGISTVYRSKESMQLYALPIGYRDIFLLKSIDSYVYSTWAFAVLGFPMIAAYGNINSFQIWHYAGIVLLAFVPFTLIPSALSSLILLLYFRFARKADPKKFALVVGTLMAGAVYIYLKYSAPDKLSLYTYQDWRILNDYLSGMALSSSAVFPSKWLSSCIYAITEGNILRSGIYSLSMLSTAVFLWQINIQLSNRLYSIAWQNAFSKVSSGAHIPKFSTFIAAPFKSKFIPLPNRVKNLIYKDVAIFFRDSAQWGQFSILIGLMLVYLFNLRFFPANLADPFWKSVVAFANFAFTGFVLATLAVRFVFPTISMEGKAFWALRAAPVKPSMIFWEKFAVSFVLFAVLAELLALISSRMLGLTPLMSALNYSGTLILSLTLTGLAVGLGAVYPDFAEQNPSKIASGAGGMLAAILSLVYVCVVVIMTAYPTHLYTKFLTSGEEINQQAMIISFAGIIFISIIAFSLPVLFGLKKLKRLEI
ncbi:MAG: hypothetical protein GF307_07090 [candidate division Zixibacteria bacterium]|nr:hypothetical protein [candidate division Zixibacteria bacterium]